MGFSFPHESCHLVLEIGLIAFACLNTKVLCAPEITSSLDLAKYTHFNNHIKIPSQWRKFTSSRKIIMLIGKTGS